MFIHCLWIVGQSRGKGYATLLLDECKDAKKAGMNGVAMVTSEDNWLVGKRFLLQQGFESVDHAPPSFELMVKRFGGAPAPSFTGDWDAKMRRCGRGLTIFHSAQCPYLDAGVKAAMEAASEIGVKIQVIELKDARQVRELSPSAYGVFGIVCDGKLVTYRLMGKREVLKRMEELRGTG
jgi:hypothetical protein